MHCIKRSQYFPKPYEPFSGDINVKGDLSNYATKADITNISHVDTSSFALKTKLANLKTEVDKLDIDKLVPVPSDLSKSSNVVKNGVIKKTDYNSKITEIENKIPDSSSLATKTALNPLENKIPDTSGLVKKNNYNAKTTEIEGKISDVTNLATKTILNTAENKIPNVSGLATKTTLTAVENKIPDISNLPIKTALNNLINTVPDISTLIKKIHYDTKIAEIEKEYVSNTGIGSKLTQANVITKISFDAKVIELENNIKNLQTFDSSYFRGKNYFEEDGAQNYLVFQPIFRYFKIIANKKFISSWKYEGLSDETITSHATSDISLTPLIDHYGNKVRVKFNKGCLKQSNKLAYSYGSRVNIYIVFEFGASSSNDCDYTLKNCLFGAVTLTKNTDIEKYGYSGFGIGFDRRSSFSFPRVGFGQNVLYFGVDMSSSSHIDNKKKDILALGKGPTQGLEHTLTAEKMYSINFAITNKKVCLSLHYNRANSYLFVNGTELYKFKAKDSEILVGPICRGNISKD